MNKNAHALTKPFFSIIIPTLNEEKRLPFLLEDLRDQTLNDFEVIIVDGKSTDKTVSRAKKFRNDFFDFKILTTNKRNVSHQRNLGFLRSRADIVLFSDADNRLNKTFLARIKSQIKDKQPDIFVTWISPDSNIVREKALVALLNLFVEVQKRTKSPYCFEALMGFKKEVFAELKGFNEAVPWGEGSELLRRAVDKKYRLSVFKTPRYVYSLRRLRTLGVISTARSVAQIELARLLRISKLSINASYPMEGGSFYDRKYSPKSTLEMMLYQVTKLSAPSDEIIRTLKIRPLYERLKKRIRSVI